MFSPKTLKSLPKVLSPTGTFIGLPVSIASAPLTSPSVDDIDIHLTISSPICWLTSAISGLPFKSILIALRRFGREFCLNLISRTGPIICTTLPIFWFSIISPLLI